MDVKQAAKAYALKYNGSEAFERRSFFENGNSLFYRNITGHYGCVNAIEFANRGGEVICSGGDDRRVLLWNAAEVLLGKAQPVCMEAKHSSNIFSVCFSYDDSKIFSGGNDQVVLSHDRETGKLLDTFLHSEAVYSIATDPNNCNVFVTACDDGRVLVFDIRADLADAVCLANYTSPMHSVVYNPAEPQLLATANSRQGVGLWDVRKPASSLLRYGEPNVQQSCMSVAFDATGRQLAVLRRRLSPVLYQSHCSEAQFTFHDDNYLNSCTMKSGCFAGHRDQYIVSGSDDFNIYIWKIPDRSPKLPGEVIEDPHMILKGHRSIVNQVRFNSNCCGLLSSGVEKSIKIWLPFELAGSIHSTSVPDRKLYSHQQYINIILENGMAIGSHQDYQSQSMQEDDRMIAFFDSLVQREVEGFSDEETESNHREDSSVVDSEFADTVQSSASDDDNSNTDSASSPFSVAFRDAIQRRLQSINTTFSVSDDDSNSNEQSRPSSCNERGKTIREVISVHRKAHDAAGHEVTERGSPVTQSANDSANDLANELANELGNDSAKDFITKLRNEGKLGTKNGPPVSRLKRLKRLQLKENSSSYLELHQLKSKAGPSTSSDAIGFKNSSCGKKKYSYRRGSPDSEDD